MNTFRKIRKNAKALSPVVASIILIAVTVAVSVVVAAWMGGMSIGLMGNAEQISVTNVMLKTDGTADITVRNTGGATVTLTTVTIDGNDVTPAAVAPATSWTLGIPKGGSDTFSTQALASGFTPDAQYQIKIITAKGNNIVYTATYTA